MTHAKRILEIIEGNPGIASFDIRKLYYPDQGHDRCVIAHQLTKLWRRGLIDRKRVSARRAKTYTYTPARKDMNNIEKVFTIVERNPGVSVKRVQEIAESNGIKPSGIPGYVTTLVNRGRLTRRKIFPDHGRSYYQLWVVEHELSMPSESPAPAQEQEVLTVCQAAEFVGISVSQLYGYHSLKWFGYTEGADGERHYLASDLARLKQYIDSRMETKPSAKTAIALKKAAAIRAHFQAGESSPGEHPDGREDPFQLGIRIATLICLHEATMATDPSAHAALTCAARRIEKLA